LKDGADWLLNCFWSSPAQSFLVSSSTGMYENILMCDGSGSLQTLLLKDAALLENPWDLLPRSQEHVTGLWVNFIHSTPLHHIYLKSVLILFQNYHLLWVSGGLEIGIGRKDTLNEIFRDFLQPFQANSDSTSD
jgi:hypothetical protein